jgi:hypothetical protein
VPANPLLRIKVTGDETSADLPEFLAFGAHPEYSRLLTTRFGTSHLFTYVPADQPAAIHLATSKDGKLAYRAFGSQGLIDSQMVEVDKEYPSWNGLSFVPLRILPAARADLLLRPKPIKAGKEGNRGVVVELESGKEVFKTSLTRDSRSTGQLGDRMVMVHFDVWRDQVPFKIRLDEFYQPTNPGTKQAAEYKSKVTLIDDSKNLKEQREIYMNHPLYHAGKDGVLYTLYQSGIDTSTGVPVSTYTVAYDPGLEVKYAGAAILCAGIFLMFYMGGYFKRQRPPARPEKARRPEPAGVEA